MNHEAPVRAWNLALRAWLLTLLTASLALTFATAWLLVVWGQTAHGSSGRDFVLELSEAATVDEFARALVEARVIDEPRLARAYLGLYVAAERRRPGPIVVRRGIPPHALLSRLLRDHGSSLVRVLIAEGATQFDVARKLDAFGIVDAERFLAACTDRSLLERLGIDGVSAEGMLFPATYDLAQDTRPDAVVEFFVRTFRSKTDPAFAARAARLGHLQEQLGFSRSDVLTLASIVEREAHLASEQRTIAGVFVNRLSDPAFRPRRLQADPTVSYGCLVHPSAAPSCQRFDGRRVTPEMVRDPANRYNTYRHDGLPPGPISNPGLGALEAVLDPEQHDYFYFVARGSGAHRFSHSFEEHLGAVRASP